MRPRPEQRLYQHGLVPHPSALPAAQRPWEPENYQGNVVWGQGEGKGREGDSIRKLHSKLVTVSWALSQLMFVCVGSRFPLFFQP